MHAGIIATLAAALLLGCGEGAGERERPPPPSDGARPASPGGPPDAGTRFGHGRDEAARRSRRSGTVVVPQTDLTPPSAVIRAAGTVAASPSRADDRPRPVVLRTNRFRATAVAVDADGGTGRIRLSLTYSVRCGDEARRVVEHRPPAQIARVRLAPGAEAPVRRTRTATLRLRAGPGCAARGEVFAEASNAHGLDAVSRHIRFTYAAGAAEGGITRSG